MPRSDAFLCHAVLLSSFLLLGSLSGECCQGICRLENVNKIKNHVFDFF